jgi:SAM-dependent MidA family methyltransferase
MPTAPHENPDALPQPIGEYRPADEWQAHINVLFYGLRGARVREFYQTFASSDFRLAHALAADYCERVLVRARGERREARGQEQSDRPPLVVLELGCGNGNLAACFLSHLKRLDREGRIYPLMRYVLVDNQSAALEAAKAHPDLADHLSHVDTLLASAESLPGIEDGTVDLILCNELWNDLPTKLMLRKDGEVEEEYLRPNLHEARHAEIADWAGFVRAFEAKDIHALAVFPSFLEDIVWEKEYRKTEWKSVPYRRTITEFLKQIDERVLVPVNLGAFATLKEAKRVLASDAVGLSGFDAGTADLQVLNDPEKPCYGQFGGQYTFMVNFALMEAVAKHLGLGAIAIESQREFVGRSLGINVLSLMDLLSAHRSAASLKPWEQDRLILQTIRTVNEVYISPYERAIEFPIREQTPAAERHELESLRASLRRNGVPDTVAYLAEAEVFGAMGALEGLGYEREMIKAAMMAPPQAVEYLHFFGRPA